MAASSVNVSVSGSQISALGHSRFKTLCCSEEADSSTDASENSFRPIWDDSCVTCRIVLVRHVKVAALQL